MMIDRSSRRLLAFRIKQQKSVSREREIIERRLPVSSVIIDNNHHHLITTAIIEQHTQQRTHLVPHTIGKAMNVSGMFINGSVPSRRRPLRSASGTGSSANANGPTIRLSRALLHTSWLTTTKEFRRCLSLLQTSHNLIDSLSSPHNRSFGVGCVRTKPRCFGVLFVVGVFVSKIARQKG
jgi:hypothetical protein